ncbi:MAG: hypothetical protein HY248_06935 [Fimbriimonas ginsengisoli]|nr:hypothetical protein [Fimbriimonas ginsengisoli]
MATLLAPDQSPEPDEDLTCLQDMLRRGDIAAARGFVKQLEQRWPDLPWVQYYARVLAPPRFVARRASTTPSHDEEYAWLAEHAAAYPGCWLAVLGDRLIAADPSLHVVDDVIRQTPGAEHALLFFQPGAAD